MRLPSRPKLSALHIDDIREHGEELKKTFKKRADIARGSVVSLLYTGKITPRKAEPGDELPVRVVTHGRSNPLKSTVPTHDIGDDVLNRMFLDGPHDNRRPTSKFFSEQRARAGLGSPTEPGTPKSAQRKRPKHSRQGLSADDLIYMFAGAPYFDVEHVEGHAQPRVVFGWGPSMEESRHASDCGSFAHKTFELCTRDRPRRAQGHTLKELGQVRETPSMRSAYGKDTGAIGFSRFLELYVGHPSNTDHLKRREQQQLIPTEPESFGLCEYNLESVLHRLSELSRVFAMLHEGNGDPREWSPRMIEEIGEDLFSTLLSSDLGTTSAGTGSVSLVTQISALQKVLARPNLWYDFSHPEERNRLPSILWDEQSVGDALNISEREVLMLQIALAAELSVRLEIAKRLAASEFRHPGIFAPDDLDVVLDDQDDKLAWDIVLFRRFIYSYEGITTSSAPSRPGSSNPLHRMSWNNGLHSDISGTASVSSRDLVFRAQHESDQMDGLLTFANHVGWEGLDFCQASISKFDGVLSSPHQGRPADGGNEYDTTLSNPTNPPWHSLHNLVFDQGTGKLLIHAVESSTTVSSGVRSWQSGFVMPGDMVSDILMNACLEQTPSAKHILNDDHADGFVYNHQMFWRRDCIASRVLAPAVGAKECMGWVSLPFVPRGFNDGWVKISTQTAPAAFGEPRINRPDVVSKSSDPLHGHDASALKATDFHQPVDDFMVPGNVVQFDGISLKPAAGQTSAFTMSLVFRQASTHQTTSNLRLMHAVHFVSSYPCFPYTKRRRPMSPTAHDSHAATDSGHSTPMSSPREKELPLPPAHHLHVDFTFVVIPAAALLSTANTESDDLVLFDPVENKSVVYHIADEEVVVLDCRGSPDLEVLARAWCSKVGEDALIGKGGRTCLACCIREAMALGIGVVIRI